MSMVIPDENGFIAMINTILLPLFFLSTAVLEKENAPGIFKVIIKGNPFSYTIDSLRNVIMDTAIDWYRNGLAAVIFILLGILSFIAAKRTLMNEND